jgi:hypothetical protein
MYSVKYKQHTAWSDALGNNVSAKFTSLSLPVRMQMIMAFPAIKFG